MTGAELQSIPLFKSLSQSDREALLLLLAEQKYTSGKTIYSPSEPSENLYIIAKGSVIITHQLDGDSVTLARLSQGYFFGEAGLLKHKQIHQSEARAEIEDTVILTLSNKNYKKLQQENPSIALVLVGHIATVLSERLTEDTTRIAIISAISDLITDPSHINDIQKLAREILTITTRAIPSHTAFLGLYKQEEQELLDIIAAINITPKHLPHTLPIDTDVYLHSLHERDGELVVPAEKYQKQEKVFYAKKNMLARSIRVEGENIGVLLLADKRTGEFSSQNRLLLAIIAGQIAFALEEARARQLKRSQEELKREYVGI